MSTTKNVRPVHAFEMLEAIVKEKDPERFKKALGWYGAKAPLNFILSLNFNHTVKLALPEGMPPMDLKDMDAQTHPDMMGLLAGSIHRVKHCLASNATLSKNKKENIFYEVLINCPLKDAEILCSAKDHALTELYPAITAEAVKEIFPQYVKSE